MVLISDSTIEEIRRNSEDIANERERRRILIDRNSEDIANERERILIDRNTHPVEWLAQLRIIDLLHSYAGGEAMWAMHNVSPQNCDRCINLSRKLMDICGVWPRG